MIRPRPLFAHALVAALALSFLAPALAGTAAAQKPWERKGPKYRVKIDSSPQQAVIYLDSKEHGILGYTPHDTKLPRGTYKVILELPGYKPFSREITVGRRNDPFLFVLERAPRPATLDVRASTQDDSAAGGRLTVDNVAVGTVPNSVEVAAGRHQVLVTKEGFNTYSEWVDVQEGERRTIMVILVKNAPQLGTLVVTADMAPAEVWVDGQKRDDAPCIVPLPAGPHTVEVRAGSLTPFKQAVIVAPGQQVKVVAALAGQIPQKGAVRVHTPGVKGAEIYIDGELKGTTPGEIGDIKPGTHVIEVRAAGRKPVEREIQVKAGETTYVKADLEALPEVKPMGRLVIKSMVPNAEVFVDGASFGQAPVTRDVPPGRYIVVVQKPGYPEFRREVQLQRDQNIEVIAEMRAVGRLMVLAPAGASVLIDGQLVGRTPMSPTEVATGDHILEIRHANYLEYRQPIKIEGGKSANFEIDLKPRPTGPTPQEVANLRRSLSSFGVSAIPPGTFTADIGFGYPYIFTGRMTVGAFRTGPIAVDGGFEFRTFGQDNQFLGHGRVSFLEAGPVTLGADFAIGGGGGPDGRNDFTMEIGAGFSLHFKQLATFTGRGYVDIYSDRMCAGRGDTPPEDLNSSREVCRAYDAAKGVAGATSISNDVSTQLGDFKTKAGMPADWDPRDGRISGTRFLLQAALEIAATPQSSIYLIIEGAPFGAERAAFMDLWNSIMPRHDTLFYARAGMTFKF
jgi:hypothetical protein